MAELSQFEKDGVEYDLKDTRTRKSVADIINSSFRLTNTVDVPLSEEPFGVGFSESDDGTPYHEEEIVVEITSITKHWAYMSASISCGETGISLGEIDPTPFIIIHIHKIGQRYVAEYHSFSGTYTQATSALNSPFHYQPEIVDAPFIDSFYIGPMKQVTAKVYAKRKLET